MKLLFATLLMHRDVETFLFNWFCSRVNLKNGFSIPHLIVNDGTLTPEDLQKLHQLTNAFIEEQPVELYKVPKAKYTAKLKLFEIGFMKYNAERVVILDPDVFFYRPWDSDLVNILLSDAITMMDFGCSTGPEVDRYENLFGVKRNGKNPGCNTGILSTTIDFYDNILLALIKHIGDPFMIMEDQGISYAAFYDHMSHIQNIKVAINGAGDHENMWNWFLRQNGAHLIGMRVRKSEYYRLVDHTVSLLPRTLHPSVFEPVEYSVPNGMIHYDLYNFDLPFASFPSKLNGTFITDAIYLSGGSHVRWKLPPQIEKFEASIMPLDNSIKENMRPISINGTLFAPGWFSCVDIINQELVIDTAPGERTFYALTLPKFHYKLDRPTTEFE